MFPEVTDAFHSLMRQPQQSDVETAVRGWLSCSMIKRVVDPM